MTLKPLMRTAALAASLAALASPGLAEEFTIFIYETPADLVLRADQGEGGKAYWAAYSAYGAELGKAGAIRGGAPLLVDRAVEFGEAVRSEGAAPLVLGGYFQIEAADQASAEAFAAKAPSVSRGGVAEVIAHMPTPGMAVE